VRPVQKDLIVGQNNGDAPASFMRGRNDKCDPYSSDTELPIKYGVVSDCSKN
jgi:hypothetical protein